MDNKRGGAKRGLTGIAAALSVLVLAKIASQKTKDRTGERDARGNGTMRPQIARIQSKALPLFRKYGVKRAAVFGSVARNEAKKTSDVDMLVEFKGRKSLLDLIGLEQELEKALGKKVDLLTYNSIHPLLKERILKEQEVIL